MSLNQKGVLPLKKLFAIKPQGDAVALGSNLTLV